MIETLFKAYTPLFTWIGLGLILSRFSSDKLAKWLGQSLYWVGVPLQLLILARRTNTTNGGLIPLLGLAVLLLSLVLALLTWWFWQWFNKIKAEEKSVEISASLKKASLGSFILATILGNTGFVGLTLTQVLTGA